MFRRQNQVSVDVFLLQVVAPLPAIPRLQFKLSVKTVLGGLGDMNSPNEGQNLVLKKSDALYTWK